MEDILTIFTWIHFLLDFFFSYTIESNQHIWELNLVAWPEWQEKNVWHATILATAVVGQSESYNVGACSPRFRCLSARN